MWDTLAIDRGSEEQDEDAAITRDNRSTWFAQQLGEEWQAEEPGIYRRVGLGTERDVPPADVGLTAVAGDGESAAPLRL